MGVTKTDFFTEKQNRLATLFKALAHPARIAIIQHLVKDKHSICSNLVDELGLAQATVSQHLKELKSIGIIKGCMEGTRVKYCIDKNVWKQIRNEWDAFLGSYRSKKACA